MFKVKLLLFSLFPLLLNAQMSRTGNLTVFSEDGDKFFLVLNGEKQNEVAQSNIRIEELTQPYYNAKIIFADQSIAGISKNNLMIADVDGVFKDVTYKIRRDKQGKPKLNYFSAADVQPNFIPPSGMYVRRWGQEMVINDGIVRQSTTSTELANATVSAGGINMSVTINDPDASVTRTTTTTTTTTTSGVVQPVRGGGSRGCSGWPMKTNDFNAAKNTINEASFDESKLSTAKTIVAANCLSTDQVISICNLFSFEENKLTFAKFAYKYTTDPQNYFKVGATFTFDSNKTELNEFISSE